MTRTLFGTDIPDPTAPAPIVVDPTEIRARIDGVPLFAAVHPRPSFWQRLRFRLLGPRDVRAATLETIDIDLPEEL